MEKNKLMDDERKISLDISRFWNEYELDNLYDVADIKEGSLELKNLTKKFEDSV